MAAKGGKAGRAGQAGKPATPLLQDAEVVAAARVKAELKHAVAELDRPPEEVAEGIAGLQAVASGLGSGGVPSPAEMARVLTTHLFPGPAGQRLAEVPSAVMRAELADRLYVQLSRKSTTVPGKTLLELLRGHFATTFDELVKIINPFSKKENVISRGSQIGTGSGFVFEGLLRTASLQALAAEDRSAESVLRAVLNKPGFSLEEARLRGSPLTEFETALAAGGYTQVADGVVMLRLHAVEADNKLLTDGVTLILDLRAKERTVVYVAGIRESKMFAGADKLAGQVENDVKRFLSGGFQLPGRPAGAPPEVRFDKGPLAVSLLYEKPPPEKHLRDLATGLEKVTKHKPEITRIDGKEYADAAREIAAAALQVSRGDYSGALQGRLRSTR